jgi:hypothetical protein
MSLLSGQANTPPPSGGFFSQLWPPMVSPLTLKSVFSQHLLLKFLDTRFRWQERRPSQPITLPKPPEDIKQLKQFLSIVNFYHRFLPNCAQVLRPLTDLLKGGAKTLEVDCFRSGGFPKC